jgi:hypothetical protein
MGFRQIDPGWGPFRRWWESTMVRPPGSRDRHAWTGPPEEAYGRVTNPERYRPLHTAAEALIDRLSAEYVVERVEEHHDLEEGVERQVSLTPSHGAPLVVEFTSFPGLAVRYGRWHQERYPWCGCDACDEDPEWVVEDFRSKVESVVRGEFSEEVVRTRWPRRSGWLSYRIGSSAGGGSLEASDPELAEPGRVEWAAWESRG